MLLWTVQPLQRNCSQANVYKCFSQRSRLKRQRHVWVVREQKKEQEII